MESPKPDDHLIYLLLSRLERISVDSYWAHRASGVRGALLKMQEQMEMGKPIDQTLWNETILIGLDLLKEAAKEYR
jgi:hypothetical protein